MNGKEKRKNWSTAQLIVAAVILLLIVAALTMSILWQINEFSLKLEIQGPEEVTIEYGDDYVDPGAAAVFQGTVFLQNPTDIQVTAESNVDTGTVGTYYINYQAIHSVNYGFGEVVLTEYARRTIHVVDTVAPQITLTTDPDAYTIPGEAYQEEGFAACDNYDGDITGQVIRTETDGIVTYQVTDSSGNSCQVERTIVYHDPIPPELTLNGETAMTMAHGTAYQEPGYTAMDNCDGDITGWVEINGNINVNKAGTYTITYTVTDSYDNTVTATRTVTVEEPKDLPETEPETEPADPDKQEEVKVEPENPVGGVIYLTFDDGPGPYTEKLLDILAKYNVKATFFVVNNGYYSTLTRMARDGHTVAIHSATHNFSEIYASEEAYFADLEKMQSIITEHTGKKPMLVRFPGGGSNTVSNFNPGIMTRLAQMLAEQGYTYFDWNVDSNDAGGTRTSIGVFNNVVTAVAKQSSSVVLMHDIKSFTVNAVEDIIMWGLENGYTFQVLKADSPTCHHRIAN